MKQTVKMLIFIGTDSILTVSHNIYCGKVHDQEMAVVIYQILILILQQPEHPLNWLLKQPLWKIQLSITVLFGKTQWYKVYEKLYKNTPTLNLKTSKCSQNQNVLSAITITVCGNTCNWYSSSQTKILTDLISSSCTVNSEVLKCRTYSNTDIALDCWAKQSVNIHVISQKDTFM